MQENKLTVVHIITKLDLGGAQKACLLLVKGIREHGNEAILISGNQGELVQAVQGDGNVILLDTFKREAGLSLIWGDIKTFFNMVRTLRAIKKQVEHENAINRSSNEHMTASEANDRKAGSADACKSQADLQRAHPEFIEGSKREHELWRTLPGRALVVHTHCPKAGIMGRWAAWFAGIKNRVHTVHGPSLHEHQPWLVWLPIYILELITSFITTHFVCVASSDVEAGKKLFPGFGKKYSIIRAAIDWERFTPASVTTMDTIKSDIFVFGTVACFKPPKNLFDLIKAFALVHEKYPNTRLEIVGDGVLRPKIEACIVEHKMMQAITLHGWQHNVIPIMTNWQAFAFSSLWEGLPCAVVEARLLKLPVLSYNTGGISDVIRDGQNGFLYPQKDWRALADGMLQLIEQPELYKRLRDHRDDLSEFNDAAMVKRHVQLYNNLTK